jgi:nucleotide-binding universal stress UspA family protein
MEMPTVIAGYEGRPQSRDALALARTLAEGWQARVVTVWVPEREEPYSTATHEALRDRIRAADRLRAAAGAVLDGGPEWEFSTEPALWPADGLKAVAREERARALVVGSSHRGPVGRAVLGSTATELLRTARCPVAVAPLGWARADRSEAMVIGVALDGCRDCEQALDGALALSDALGARLVAISVSGHGGPRLEAQLTTAAVAGAGQLRLEGGVADSLADASRELDLLMVGCRDSRWALGRPFRSVSRQLLQTAACPLLIVPESPVTTH